MKRQHILILFLIAVLKAVLAFTNHTPDVNNKLEDRGSSMHSALYTVDPNRFRVSTDTLLPQKMRKEYAN
ncbi:hypothetical protein OKW21_000729 [Catalinimonas alkaloidigena]|uniref:hypothetical protein n=1 Tax=Catalinimonas alkaloidigena TaxID=1075417 RepID=UPI00240561EE|nr:hypothetical protein [Catalinimonas alkaloidigena]MDF9795466.1 hypothetical protein [Catalinimonas alkaloidigena]